MALNRLSVTILICLFALPLSALATEQAEWIETHALAMHGEPKHDADFKHFDYVNPDAPKGGTLRRAELGTFDSFHPFLLIGQPPQSMTRIPFYDTLMRRSWDEPFTMYPLIAEKVKIAPDRSGITFYLNRDARFHDGHPITVEDVQFSFDNLKKFGRPNARRIYSLVTKVETKGDRQITFYFGEGYDQETALILSMMPILPKHDWQERAFDKTTLEVPLGSGPYKISEFEPGRQLTYQRVKDYWAADLPVNVGHYNFDSLVHDYYRDDTVALEAFAAGAYDMRREWTAHKWLKDYDFASVKNGEVIKSEFSNERPQWARFMIFNTRKFQFSDRKVRKALSLLFDFSWINKTLFNDAYKRVDSYFPNSPLAHQAKMMPVEKKILEKYDDKLSPQLFEQPKFSPIPPEITQPGLRARMRLAVKLLSEAGWEIAGGVMKNRETGAPLAFEILLDQPSNEKIALHYIQVLKKIGVQANVRTVDSAQYAGRLQDYNFYMIFHFWKNSLSPGTEQAVYWSSRAADMAGGLNYPGAKNESIDKLVAMIPRAKKREDLVAATRALDRALAFEWFGIPLYYSDKDYIAHDEKLKYPSTTAIYGPVIQTWWRDDVKEEKR